MQQDWPDIQGVTAVEGRARLPRRPAVAVRALAMAVEGANAIGMAELVDQVQRSTGADRSRIEGLAGWLPVSRVAAWNGDGTLALDPHTDVGDLAIRYAAWIGTQPVTRDQADQIRTYAEAVVTLATELPRPARPPGPEGALPKPAGPVSHPTTTPLVDPALTEKIRGIVTTLDRGFLERRQHTRAALLALLAGQHVLLLGPPGTAKSMLARALCTCFRDGNYFEYLLSRFTHPDELFGPVSIPGLKDEDYRRLTQGFLPKAHVAFLDEIFKANSAILNSLLTLVNERVFHHGRHRDRVPLIGLIGASNELPDPEGGLGALFDRFLVRLTVPPLATPDAFLAVATSTVETAEISADHQLGSEDLAALRQAAQQVDIPPEVRDALVTLWRHAARSEWQVSDRRWRQATEMLRVAAAADGRRSLILLDLLLLEPVLAPDPGRGAEVREAVLDQLGTGAIPEHDLRAQWVLLGMDRVAPLPQTSVSAPPEDGEPWQARVVIRQANVQRFLAHHAAAVRRLAGDRASIEDIGDAHLWLSSLPAQVLATHIEASRELARILKSAERYAEALATPDDIAKALVERLPQTTRRMYGHGAVCIIEVTGTGVMTGITLAGERETLPRKTGKLKQAGGLVLPTETGDLPVLRFDPTQFLDWVDGQAEQADILGAVPSWGARNVATALGSVRRLLQRSAVPAPPDLAPP